jgi:hypothetical protein
VGVRRIRKVLPGSGGEVVDDVNIDAASDESVDEIRADETRAADDDGPNGPRIVSGAR